VQERVASVLRELEPEGIEQVLNDFGYVVTEGWGGAPSEEDVLRLLRRHHDDARLLDLDDHLHAGDTNHASPESSQRSYFEALAAQADNPLFGETRSRLQAVRWFLTLMETVVDDATAPEARSRYQSMREQRHPYVRRVPIDFDVLGRRETAAREFPLIAWAPSLAYCFSVLERFLADATALAADRLRKTPPEHVPSPKIEGWLAALASFGVTIPVPPETISELKALRPVRNALTHRLSLDANQLPAGLHRDLDMANVERILPTPLLVRRALRAVDDVICATETVFGIDTYDRYSRILHNAPSLRRRPPSDPSPA
jgi:hypothetical protein